MTIDTILIMAPFWGDPNHVGNYRIERFIRWFSAKNTQVILVCAGPTEQKLKTTWGYQVHITDPLKIYGRYFNTEDTKPNTDSSDPQRKPNAFRRWIAERVFNPDVSIVWSKRAVKHPLVQAIIPEVSAILASSPPDGIHQGAYLLAKSANKPLLIDRRDGWLDEPLKPLLQHSVIRRWQEGRLEKQILKYAAHIFVTSEVWQSLLSKRLPYTRDKITTLPNACPKPAKVKSETVSNSASNSTNTLTLLHAGRFTGSHNLRTPEHILNPLRAGLSQFQHPGKVICIGSLETKDYKQIESYTPTLNNHNWDIETQKPIPRDELLLLMQSVQGLLLLSTSFAAVPSKFLEYLTTDKPILAATPKNSAVWKMAAPLDQVFLVDYTQHDLNENNWSQTVSNFLSACHRNDTFPEVPDMYTEDYLSKVFFQAIQKA